MNQQPNSKIIGAFVIGFAVVGASYVLTNFGETSTTYTAGTGSTAQNQQAAPVRSAITVLDENNNGIEDWRDEFVTTDPIIIDEFDEASYVPPETLTGQTSIDFIQDVLAERTRGSFGNSQETVIQNTISRLEQQTSRPIYDVPDILIQSEWDEQSIRTYANTLATVIISSGQSELDYELLIMQDIMNRGDRSRLNELQTISEIYGQTRDTILEIPVPSVLAKQHLDFINTLHALQIDVEGMTLAFDDPMYSLMRIQRYEDDVYGMIYALQNIYLALEPYASLFEVTDPAVLFVQFSPSSQVRI